MGIFDISLKEVSLKEVSTKGFTIMFILIMIAIGAFNIWLLMNFRKLQFTSDSKASHSHTVVEALLWLLSILPLVIALGIGALFVSKKSERYKLPLIGLIATLLIYSFLQLIISFYWKNLDVVNRSSPAFINMSDAVLFSGYLTLPLVLVIIGIWWFIAEKSPKWAKEKIKKEIAEKSEETKEARKIYEAKREEEEKAQSKLLKIKKKEGVTGAKEAKERRMALFADVVRAK